MQRKKQLFSLFSQLCDTLGYNNLSDNSKYRAPSRYAKGLKLDFNSVYGGYSIRIVNENTSEDFFCYSSRTELKETISFIQGVFKGLELNKKN